MSALTDLDFTLSANYPKQLGGGTNDIKPDVTQILGSDPHTMILIQHHMQFIKKKLSERGRGGGEEEEMKKEQSDLPRLF